MKSLNEIMEFYGTDKMEVDHNYVPVYLNILNGKEKDKLKILEIGIYRPQHHEQIREIGKGRRLPGASLRTWHDYLPNAEIYGIDLGEFKDIENERIKTFVCNQESKEQLNDLISKIGSDFDMIIDDGGHTMRQHQVSISVLFKHLKSGGVYVIEDLVTCEWPQYAGKDLKTTVMLRDFQNDGKIKSQYIDMEESTYLEENIKSMEITQCKLSEIAVIYKK
jgi:hypothetical protein